MNRRLGIVIALLGLILIVLSLTWLGVRVTTDQSSETGGAAARCAEAAEDVDRAGLALPEGWSFLCPGNTDAGDGEQHAGVACPFISGCPAGPGPYIAVNPQSLDRSGGDMAAVVAHERAHAQELVERGETTEESASCIALSYGFSLDAQLQPDHPCP